MLKLTLTPNRGDQERYSRIVVYHRFGDLVLPWGVREYPTQPVKLKWSQIKRQPVDIGDLELRDHWQAHVDAEHARVVAEAKCQHEGCDQRHDPPTTTRQQLIDRGLITLPADYTERCSGCMGALVPCTCQLNCPGGRCPRCVD